MDLDGLPEYSPDSGKLEGYGDHIHRKVVVITLIGSLEIPDLKVNSFADAEFSD